MNHLPATLGDLNDRSREIFRQLVETYLETGDPVGSRTLSRALDRKLSAATVRNVMQDLEELGLLGSPHVSAGRIPTQTGLRMFVDGLLEIGDVSDDERGAIERSIGEAPAGVPEMVAQAGAMLSGLTRTASLVLAPKAEAAIRHIEFVTVSPGMTLVVLVTEDGAVENRMFSPPPGVTPSAMQTAANFLNATLRGRTLSDAAAAVGEAISQKRAELDELAASLVEQGFAVWADGAPAGAGLDRLVIRGRANLLEDVEGEEALERIRMLFDDLERKKDLLELLELAQTGEGVRIFIGSENKLFSLSGSSLVIAPYMDADRRIIGALGVIGPTRLNYGRVVPIVDYTARLMGRLVSDRQRGGTLREGS
jgi:heat-inducible transcriptional repressor